jgi:hypothetical protein
VSEEAVSQGAIYGDVVDDVLWFNYGVYLRNTPSSWKGLLVSRPMLEELVRRRVLQLLNVRLHEQTEILEPICDRMEGRVTGVRSQSTAGTCTSEVIDCDLLVDASGRGSKSPTWLEALAYAKPLEDSIRVDIGLRETAFPDTNSQSAAEQVACLQPRDAADRCRRRSATEYR